MVATLLLGDPLAVVAQEFAAPALISNSVPIGDDFDPQVTTDGAGNWVATWWSTDSLGGTIGTDYDILVARSTDDGATWTVPEALNTNAAVDSGLDRSPQVTTDGAGNWVAAWQSWDSPIGDESDILVARSTDNGATWTAPVPLNTNAATDSGGDGNPQVMTDGAGNWVATWMSNDSLSATIGTDFDILVARSTDNGASWTAPAALNTNAATDSGDDFKPQITTDGAGNWMAAWESWDSLGGTIGDDDDILVARSTDNGATWTAPEPLNTDAAADSGDDGSPQITTDSAGNWVATWHSNDSLGGTIGTDYDILVARSTDNGETWTAPAALSANAAADSGDDVQPHLATDVTGNWVATWTSTDSLGGTIGTDYDILVARSTDNGATWTAPAALNTNAATDSGDDLATPVTVDGAGNWVAIWSSNDSLGGASIAYDILVARSTDGGATWTAPVAFNTKVATVSGIDVAPQVTTDGTGHWVATWASNDSLGGTIGTDLDILVALSIDNGTSWTVPATLNTNAAADAGDDYGPQVTTDGAGHWVATWASFDTLGGSIGSDGDIMVARSIDDGATWTAPATLNGNAATDSGYDAYPQITTDSAGNWVATWFSNDSLGGTIGNDFDILVAHSTDDGATWTVPAALNANAASDSGVDYGAQVTTDGTGHWVAVWASNDSLGGTIWTDYDVLIARSTDNGATWTAPVALNTNAAADDSRVDFAPQVTTDGSGNWVATWSSDDSLGGPFGTDLDIFVARSTDNGATWTAPAALNANAATDSGLDGVPQITTDEAGHWAATWTSGDDLGGTIGTDLDILIARSTDNGATWTAPATLNTTAATDSVDDFVSQLTTDGTGNWLAIWTTDGGLGGPEGFSVGDIFVSLGGICGDGTMAGPEDCDDGGLLEGDCCSSTCTLEGPLDPGSCLVAPNTRLQIADSTDPARDRLVWQWGKGDAFDQLDLGIPTADTAYVLCVYDTSAFVPSLTAAITIEPSPTLWTSKDPKGYKYGDTHGTSDGVTKLQLKTGDATETKVKLSAKGMGLTLPTPFGSTYFEQWPKVIAQLVSSDGVCWTSEFGSLDVRKNDAVSFRAQTN